MNNYRLVGTIMCTIGIMLFNGQNILASQPINFSDSNLKAAVEAELGISDPNATDMLELTTLYAMASDIKDLTGLEYATNMRYLDLWRNQITSHPKTLRSKMTIQPS